MPAPNFSEKLPSDLVKNPPKKGESGKEVSVICPNDHRGGCGHAATATFSEDESLSKEEIHTCLCPKCGEFMVLYWGDFFTFSISMKGPGFSETKTGMRMKRDRLWRSETLAKTQWEKHQPQSVADPTRIRNPTPGGPLDPNSKFNKGRKKVKKIYT